MSDLEEKVKEFEMTILKFMREMSGVCLSDVGTSGQVRKHKVTEIRSLFPHR